MVDGIIKVVDKIRKTMDTATKIVDSTCLLIKLIQLF